MIPRSETHARAIATARSVQAYRLVGLGHKPRRGVAMPRAIPPKAIEKEYGRALVAIVARVRLAFAPLLARLPALTASAIAERREDSDETKEAARLLAEARKALGEAVKLEELQALADKFAARTSTYQRIQLGKQTRAALGADVFVADRRLGPLTEAFNDANVSLIKDVTDTVAAGVEKATMQALTSGTRHEDLAKQLDAQFGYGEKRATLIARDQVGKLYGQVTAARQREVGVSRFVWRTVADERVREEHEARDGNTYDYADPPEGELPGEPILCRCYAEPVFDMIEEAIDPIPDAKDLKDPAGVTRTIPASELLARGYTQPDNMSASKLRNAREIVAKGQRDPIKVIVHKSGELEVDDGRHRLAAAIEAGVDVKVRFVQGGKGVVPNSTSEKITTSNRPKPGRI